MKHVNLFYGYLCEPARIWVSFFVISCAVWRIFIQKPNHESSHNESADYTQPDFEFQDCHKFKQRRSPYWFSYNYKFWFTKYFRFKCNVLILTYRYSRRFEIRCYKINNLFSICCHHHCSESHIDLLKISPVLNHFHFNSFCITPEAKSPMIPSHFPFLLSPKVPFFGTTSS